MNRRKLKRLKDLATKSAKQKDVKSITHTYDSIDAICRQALREMILFGSCTMKTDANGLTFISAQTVVR